MTSEPNNIVNLRDSLPPLQSADTPPSATPVPAPHRKGTPLGIKGLFAIAVGMIGVAMAYLGYTGQWPRIPAASVPAPESTLPVAPPARPDAPARDVLYSISVDPTPITPPAVPVDPLAHDVEPTRDAAVDSALREHAVVNTTPEPQAPASPNPLTPSRNAATRVSNDLSLAHQNQTRIEAIEGYIVEMLTVIDAHKTELRALHAALDKNTATIDQQMQRVSALLQQQRAIDTDSASDATATTDTPLATLPFHLTSIRQFGETLSIRVDDAQGNSRLMVPGQRLAGWELLSVDPDRRHAEFVHAASQRHEGATL